VKKEKYKEKESESAEEMMKEANERKLWKIKMEDHG
jgi:hypothetical protein